MMDEYDPQAEMEAIHKQVGGWFDAFVGGPQYQPLTEIQRAKAPGIVRFFTECSFRHIGAAPEKWNQSVLKYLSSLPSQTRPQRPLPVRQR